MEIEIIETEICIVGAGPAGTTTSIALSNMGIAHTIVDAASFPRDKICGDALDLNVVRVLNTILPGFVANTFKDPVSFSKAKGLLFRLPNGKSFEMTDKSNKSTFDNTLFFISKRLDFDRLLLSQLHPSLANWHPETRIEKMERQGNSWVLSGTKASGKVEIRTKMVVGADGAHSVVLRHIGDVKIDRQHYAGAVRQYWKGIEGIHPDGLIEVYFPKSLPLSYFWIFPLPGGVCNVGFGLSSSYIAKKNINVRKAFEELVKSDPQMSPRFRKAVPVDVIKGWGLPMSGSNRKAFGDGWLLTGDAASIICPTTGEGIGSGMMSGYTAAQFLQRAHLKHCYEEKMFSQYNREIHKRLVNDERVYNFFNRMPAWLFTAATNCIFSSKILQNRVVRKEVHKWIETAYTKPVRVNID